MKNRREFISADLRLAVWAASGRVCAYCDQGLERDGSWHVEHVVPFSVGGKTEIANLVAACVTCNLIAKAGVYQSVLAKRAAIRRRRSLPPDAEPITRLAHICTQIPDGFVLEPERDATVLSIKNRRSDAATVPRFVTIAVRLTEDDAAPLTAEAKRRGVSVGEVLREIAQRHRLDAALEVLPGFQVA